MKKYILLVAFAFFAHSLYAQFYAGRHYTTLEYQINKMNQMNIPPLEHDINQTYSSKINILNAPLEYDALAGFTGHKIQLTKSIFIIKFIVKVNVNGVITECINYLAFNPNNASISEIVAQERTKTLDKYKTLSGKFKIDNEYTFFFGDSFIGMVCTDRNKPFVHYEALKSEY